MSQALGYQKLWFVDGLSFACTQCGRCCYGASQRQIRLNETERQAAAEHLKTSRSQFEGKFMIPGTDQLHANIDGSCVLLKNGKCSIHPVRPTQCATYPFWAPHVASASDWRATAATCEGITVPAQHKAQLARGSAKGERPWQLILDFRTSPQAGHGVEPPRRITPAQVVKALIMNEVHASGDIPETAMHCEELLSSALEETELQETIDDIARMQRRVVYEDEHVSVLDSRIDDQWQRDVVLASSPCHTQSCVLLDTCSNGELKPQHSQLPSRTPVFQMLAACVPGLRHLRDLRHPASMSAPIAQRLSERQMQVGGHEERLPLPLSSGVHSAMSSVDWAMKVAVVGAGACTVPAHLVHSHADVLVHAVDINAGMLHVAQQHMGVAESDHLRFFQADGLDFIRPDFNSSTRSVHGYDVIILDVAVPSQVMQEGVGSGSEASVVAPAPEFLGDRFLGDAVWRRLRPDGMLVINALGSEDYLRSIEDMLSRHAQVFRWSLIEGDTTVLLALPITAPSPESVQLEGWDNVWGHGIVPYWVPGHVAEADILHSILPFCTQERSVVKAVQLQQSPN